MRKITIDILLATVLLGAAITNSHAATDESGNDATIKSSDDTLPPEPGSASNTLPPEPGTASDTKAEAAGDSSEEAARKRLQADLQAKAELATKAKDSAEKRKREAHTTMFWGKYFGAKFGINNSSVSGTINAPSASTLAFGVQGGYLQAGYNWEASKVIVGVGAYADWNNYAIHSNDIAYSSSAYGLDIKLGVPVDEWLPYVKLGYGYSTGNKNDYLRTVSQNSRNDAIGIEYNVAFRWSLIAEFKIDNFSNRDKSITIHNKLFTFGFNYYFDQPIVRITEKAPEIDLAIPAPIIDPNAAPEAPPPP